MKFEIPISLLSGPGEFAASYLATLRSKLRKTLKQNWTNFLITRGANFRCTPTLAGPAWTSQPDAHLLIPGASGHSRNANASTNLIVFASLEKFTYHFSVYQFLNTNGILFKPDPNSTMQPARPVTHFRTTLPLGAITRLFYILWLCKRLETKQSTLVSNNAIDKFCFMTVFWNFSDKIPISYEAVVPERGMAFCCLASDHVVHAIDVTKLQRAYLILWKNKSLKRIGILCKCRQMLSRCRSRVDHPSINGINAIGESRKQCLKILREWFVVAVHANDKIGFGL